MGYGVTAALVGDRDAPAPGAISAADFRKPWDERDKVKLDVAEDEPLASVIARAVEALAVPPFEDPGGGIRSPGPFFPFFVAFRDPEGRIPLEERLSEELTLVDAGGHAIWGATDFRLVPYKQLMRSSEAETIDGDPTQLYLIRRMPQGGGVPGDWGRPSRGTRRRVGGREGTRRRVRGARSRQSCCRPPARKGRHRPAASALGSGRSSRTCRRG